MTELREMHADALLNVVGCTFLVYGVARALFRSFWAQEIAQWIQRGTHAKQGRMQALRFELKNGIKWRQEFLSGHDDMLAGEPLAEDEIRERRREMASIARSTRRARAVLYLLSCPFCQAFWVALFLTLFTVGVTASAVASAFVYATASLLVGRLLHEFNVKDERVTASESRRAPAGRRRGGCGGG